MPHGTVDAELMVVSVTCDAHDQEFASVQQASVQQASVQQASVQQASVSRAGGARDGPSARLCASDSGTACTGSRPLDPQQERHGERSG